MVFRAKLAFSTLAAIILAGGLSCSDASATSPGVKGAYGARPLKYPRAIPHGLYGGAFLNGYYGNRAYGYTVRGDYGLPVAYFSRPSHYRFTANGHYIPSAYHRWHALD